MALASEDIHYETVTDDTGNFRQQNLLAAQYSVNAFKDGVGDQIFRILLHPESSVEVYFRLEAGRRASPWLRMQQDRQEIAEVFAAGVQANRAGDFEYAIEQFGAVLRLTPTCVDCYFNIGLAYSRLDRFSEAESSYRRALQIRSDYAPAYYGLAEMFARQDRPEDAAAARGEANRIAVSSLAADRALAQDALGRGIDFWNAGEIEHGGGSHDISNVCSLTRYEYAVAKSLSWTPEQTGLLSWTPYLVPPDGPVCYLGPLILSRPWAGFQSTSR